MDIVINRVSELQGSSSSVQQQLRKSGDAKLSQAEAKKEKLQKALDTVFIPCKDGSVEPAAKASSIKEISKVAGHNVASSNEVTLHSSYHSGYAKIGLRSGWGVTIVLVIVIGCCQ